MKLNGRIILLFVLIINFVSCQKQKEEDLYKTAMEDLKNGNTKSAIENLEKIIDQNPYSEIAPEAYFTLGSLYQSIDDDSVHRTVNYQKALSYYLELIDKFPNHKHTPEAIFMAGFISVEYLKDYQNASHYYKKFLKAYPDHELAVSVKAELENLGKSPEEILREKGIDTKAKGN